MQKMEAQQEKEEDRDVVEDPPQRHRRLSRRRSFSDRLEEENDDLRRQLDKMRKERDDLEEKCCREGEENRLLKKRIAQCPNCSTGSPLQTIVKHIEAEDPFEPEVVAEQFQSSPAVVEGDSAAIKPEEDTTTTDACKLCCHPFLGPLQFKVEYCHECVRFDLLAKPQRGYFPQSMCSDDVFLPAPP